MIIYIAFIRALVIPGGGGMEFWSGRKGETDSTILRTTIEDRKDLGVVVKYRAGDLSVDITVPMSNISQVTRQAPAEQTKEQKR